MNSKQILSALAAPLLLLAACGSDGTTEIESGGAPSATTAPATAVPTDAAITDPAATDDVELDAETIRSNSYQILVTENGFDGESADCVVDGLFELTGSYDLDPPIEFQTDEAAMRGLQDMALTCQGIEIPAAPVAEVPVSNLTIEEWRQNAGDLTPDERNGLYGEVGYPPMTIDQTKNYVAVLSTPEGDMRFELAADLSPITVNSFVNLAEDGYFDGLTFHRVLEGFMAQGGDPSGLGSGGPGYQFPNESTEGIEFTVRGILAMANAGANTNGSQFFITFDEAEFLGGANYTIFGRMVDGDETLASVDLRDPGSAVDPGTLIETVTIEVS